MTTDYILAVDQSTSATKACLFDREARMVSRVTIEHQQYYPKPGWVEHDALEIFANTRSALSGALESAGVKPEQVAAIAVTNQRETVVAWDSETGIPVHRALVWQDERGTERCRQLLAGGEAAAIQKKTGLVVDTYFSASKLQWLMDNSAECKRAAAAGTLMAGTMDTWVIWNLTGRTVFATDHSNASRTLLYNIETCAWDNELRSIFHASDVQLPEVRFADQSFGITTIGDSSVEIPIYGVMGDSHAALFGHAGFSVGDAKTTFGTGSSVMMNVGSRMLTPPAGIVSSIAWGVNQTVSYVYEGNIHSTGDTMRWVRDQLGLFSSYADAEQRAAALEDNGGVYVVPAFSGLGAPHWVHGIRATISGLARSSTADHIIRAALESIAFQVHDVIATMTTGGGVSLPALRVDGGPTANRFLMQFLADILGVPVRVGEIEEISARGVAFAAGMATGFWQGPGDLAALASLAALVRPAATFSPSMPADKRSALIDGWHAAVTRTLTMASHS